ncbi:hypothetical protein ABI_16280 [Asticcacaulis biprosthecium C19]|uniref:Uncharacterized protein n=1 Tax=Asticcacaulis biprosthecium C19 TaxID=715226 RepID=F4QJT1_9CAUL|nr:hypothetical protein [Asticcacaulis biprosthecium]EGF93188.1 hypothetical protein ABI_16280 [Asticcacaulis biprosthecium C19]
MRGMISGLAVAAVVISLAGTAGAATVQAQLRFQIKPTAADPAWATPGAKFEKMGECAYISGRAVASWPQRVALAKGQATAPVFNPGFPQPDGTYLPNSADDGFNTLFYPIEAVAGVKSVVCRGTILANGVDVTADTPGRVAAASAETIGKTGPLMVAPELDTARLAKVVTDGGTPTPTGPIPGVTVPSPSKTGGGHVNYINGKFDFETGTYEGTNVGGNTPWSGAGPRDIRQDGYKDKVTIKPLTGAHFLAGGPSATARGYLGCHKAAFGASPNQVKVGEYYCFRTVENNLVEIAIQSVKPTSNESAPWQIDFGYKLWTTPPFMLGAGGVTLTFLHPKLDVETGVLEGSGPEAGSVPAYAGPRDLRLDGYKADVTLRTLNGAQYATSGAMTTAPSYSGCNGKYYGSEVPAKVKAGEFYCLKTGEGHLVEIKINAIKETSYAPNAPYEVSLSYTVWK